MEGYHRYWTVWGKSPVSPSLGFGQHGDWQVTKANRLTTPWPAAQALLWEQLSELSWAAVPVQAPRSQQEGSWSLPAPQCATLVNLSLVMRPQLTLPQHTHAPRGATMPIKRRWGFDVSIWLNSRGILDGFLLNTQMKLYTTLPVLMCESCLWHECSYPESIIKSLLQL